MVDARQYTIRRKILSLLGSKFHIYDPSGNLIGYCKKKAFKLREDIRIYTDESMSQERLAIKARSILDFSAAYDIVDGQTGEQLGALKRQGLKSMFRDQWQVFDAQDRQIGILHEDSVALALVRRFLTNLIPQHFELKDGSGTALADFRTHFNPFVHKMTVTVSDRSPLNPAVPLAAGMLLMAIEGRQED